MEHTNDRSTKTSSLVNPTSLNLQPRPFALLDSEEKDEAISRKSGYTENFLEKIINTPSSESATPVQRKSGNRLKAIAAERMAIQSKPSTNAALQNQPVQRQESVEEEKSEGELEDAKEFTMNPEPPPVQRKSGNRLKAIAAERQMAIQAKQSTDAESVVTVQRKSGNRLKAIAAERMALQAKLTIGQPNDKYEQEADATAARVVQQIHSSTNSQSQPIQRQDLEDDDKLQMKPLVQRSENLGGGEASTDLESAIQSARGSGQSLEANLQQSMGQAMGADFSGVKVHTDSQSDQLNKSIQAKAFTTGQDLFFRQGAYEPSSRSGQELIAHELTHVVQQNGGAVQRSQIQREDLVEGKDQFADDAIYKRKYKRIGSTSIFLTDEDGSLKLNGNTPQTKKLKKENKLQIVRREIDPDGLPEGEYCLVKFMEVDVNQQKADTLNLNWVYGYTKPDTIKALGEYKDISTIGTSNTNPKQGKILPQAQNDPPISQTDVFQSAISDCYLHAALISIAEVNPAAITGLFTRVGDADLDITFPGFNDSGHQHPVLKVTVQKKLFIAPDGSPLYGGRKDSYLWPAFIQKAWAISKGKYANLPMGKPFEIIGMISGEKSKIELISSEKGSPEVNEAWKLYILIVESLENSRPLVAGTKTWTDKTTSMNPFKSDGYKMPQKSEHGGIGIAHCYSILGINDNAQIRPEDNPEALPNAIKVTLRDPRTPDKLLQTPLEDLLDKRKFAYVTGN
ncbi:DUF4157 domain-containing protein [Pseudanabaena sp. BC1403]|uniref:eCIS core domain-containing protein n=1 Tax=Pseudanabaena sp. BC1403 TaxID=2043171 RepID=UPI0011AF330F|nr:DUF4157 domain-containing protein [Pseudanabaena sp. BC1403]